MAQRRMEAFARGWFELVPSEAIRRLARRLVRTHPLRAADALQLSAALTLAAGGVETLRFACSGLQLCEVAEIENLIVLRPSE